MIPGQDSQYYLNLLKRYIQHVCEEEGTTFIDSFDGEGRDLLLAIREELYPPNPNSPTTATRSDAWSETVKKVMLQELESMKYKSLR